ncbi:MAG: FAD/NAD(P)-binding protein, partial [Thermomicrobiales bacterium]
MGSPRNQATVAFIGGGPRAVGLVERINANALAIAPDTDLTILIFDPHPAGPGRVWRYDQSPSLKMNSLAEDVAMFSDSSSVIEGPVIAGPTLAEWVEQVRNGEIAFTSPDPQVAAELDRLGWQGFATRRLLSCYLRWFFEQTCGLAPEHVHISEIRARVERVVDFGTHQILECTDEAGLLREQPVDFVVYTVGHTAV